MKGAAGCGYDGVGRIGEEVWQEGRVDHWGEGKDLKEREVKVGKGVHREVGADWRRGARGFQNQGHHIWGEAGAQKAR